jgi:hypothetical protein
MIIDEIEGIMEKKYLHCPNLNLENGNNFRFSGRFVGRDLPDR